MKDANCIFCKICAGEIPSNTIYEDEKYKVIMDISPAANGHAIIILKNHVPDIFELSDDDAEGLFRIAKKVSIAMKKVISYEGINILQNNGEAAGQTVKHLHVHLIPRFNNDTVNIKWLPINTDADKLKTLAQKIRVTIENKH